VKKGFNQWMKIESNYDWKRLTFSFNSVGICEDVRSQWWNWTPSTFETYLG
jgi:hypothetical protein